MSETETETVLIFQREHSNRIEEWVAPHNDVRMAGSQSDVRIYDAHEMGSSLLYLAHVAEAHLIIRPKPVDISD